jgi:hypothetical protein
MTYGIFSCLLFCASFSIFAQEAIPEPLKPWVQWVKKGSENLSCPFINKTSYANKANHICAWPSTLALDVQDNSAKFKQSWRVLTKSKIPLPGNAKNWPLAVKIDNKDVPVFTHQGMPTIELEKGSYVIEGKFEWMKMPQSIAIPKQYAFVEMTINNRAVAFPKIEGSDLWLQKFQPKVEKRDSIDISVVRRVSDGPFIKLETFISINMSGKMREVELGKVLPEGFELIGISSKVSSFLDGDGVLHAKLKPGRWTIKVNAYAQPTLLSWKRPEQTHHWPEDEIWVFEGDENLRLGKIEGAKMIDSSQATMPAPWYQLPSYLVNTSNSLSYEVQHRGKPLHLENQLSLNRTLWLSFDSSEYTFNDYIKGAMIDEWRLSMKTPYLLESAENQDGAVLITTKEQGERGVENRSPQVNVQARGIIGATQELPVTGWDNDFERVSLIVNLPPGNKLFAVFGADYVSNSWWENWTIWASFIVLLSSLMASRLINITAGISTTLMLLFIYQEGSAPVLAIINLLIAIAIKKHQPFERIKKLIKAYWIMSVALAVGAILLFSATQLRTVIHPQLESKDSSAQSFNNRNFQQESQQEYLDDSIAVESVKQRTKSAIYNSIQNDQIERIEVTGSRVPNTKNTAVESMMERYQSDAVMQAGSGIPDWQWNSYRVEWNSPVAKDQMFDVIILSKGTYRVIKILGILLTLLWLFVVLKDVISSAFKKLPSKAIASILAVFMLMPSYTPTVEAADFPDQYLLEELKARVTKAPLCAPDCAAMNSLVVSTNDKSLRLSMSVHANVATAIAIPKSEFWRPEKISINGKEAGSLFRNNGWIYIPVDKGLSMVVLQGQVAPVDVFQLEFKDKPKHVKLLNTQQWEVLGNQGSRLSGNALEFVAKVKIQQGSEQTSTRYNTKPFVKVTRELSVDQLWTVRTSVERIAPSNGSINVKVPTLVGENIMSADLIVENDYVEATIPAGKRVFSWTSTIERQQTLTLHAKPEQALIEQWRVIVSPAWHAELSGLPTILDEQSTLEQPSNNEFFTYLFYPYPDETLTIAVTRPDAVKGHVLAVDKVNYTINQGSRTSKLELVFDYRSTRGGEHVIDLPVSYQLKEISIDNKLINLQLEDGKLAIPILPGKHNVKIMMRANVTEELLLSAPEINLNAPVSNITSVLNVSNQRWVLWAKGPLLGPAVLYWGELLAFILLALLVSRVKFSPLSTGNWIVLGFGLSLSNWGILMVIAVWFASITASTYRSKELSPSSYNISQLFLYGLSVAAVISLLSVVPMSLLSSPSMGIEGNSSYGNHLQWFSDKSSGLLPAVSVVSISTLFYKGLMLIWVIWLSFALLGWMKWSWKTLGQQGYWKSKLSKLIEEK